MTTIAASVSVACDICHDLSTETKIGTPEFPETDRRYGPVLCPDCFTTWENDAAEKSEIENNDQSRFESEDQIVYRGAAYNPDDGRMVRVSEWDRVRGYFLTEYD